MPQLSDSIENPEIDIEIQKIFKSNKLAKKSLCYKLNGKSYNILLIHNPEKVKLTSKLAYNTPKHGRLSCIASCNKRVCIFVDTKAPRALIKHIASLYTPSWWGRWKLVIRNGSKLEAQYFDKKRFSTKYTIYTYTPCTWYEAMMNATPG